MPWRISLSNIASLTEVYKVSEFNGVLENFLLTEHENENKYLVLYFMKCSFILYSNYLFNVCKLM
jgi:hypothetical protein